MIPREATVSPLRSLRLTALILAAGCVPPGNPGVTATFVDVTTEQVGDEAAPVLRVVASIGLNAGFDAEGYLDGASLVVNDRGKSTSFEAPALTATGFPLSSRGGFGGLGTITLEVPSPLLDTGTFDSFCTANPRTVDITAQIYVPQNDRDPDEPAPLVTATINAPIVEQGTPPVDGVFTTSNVAGQSSGSSEAPRPGEIVPWQDGVVFAVPELGITPECDEFSACMPNTTPYDFLVFRARPGSIQSVYELDVAEAPRLAAYGDTLYYAGKSLNQGLEVGQVFATGTSVWRQLVGGSYEDNIRPSALSAHAGGLRVAIRSAVALEGLNGEPIAPPAEKYFGSFLFEYDTEGTLLSSEATATDIVTMIDLPDGRRALATAELPPRESEPELHVEMLDPQGAVLFGYDEPALTYDAALHPLADGGLLVATEDREVTDSVLLIRLSNDGTVIFKLRALGRDAHAAPLSDGSALWAFTGSLTGLPAPAAGSAPDRTVPLLLQVSADGTIARVSQLGCSGWAAVGASASGPLLLGSFDEWASLGSEVRPAKRSDIFVAGVQ